MENIDSTNYSYEDDNILLSEKKNEKSSDKNFHPIKCTGFPAENSISEQNSNLENVNVPIESFENRYSSTLYIEINNSNEKNTEVNKKNIKKKIDRNNKKLLGKKTKNKKKIKYQKDSFDDNLDLLKLHLYIDTNSKKNNICTKNFVKNYINDINLDLNDNKRIAKSEINQKDIELNFYENFESIESFPFNKTNENALIKPIIQN